MDHTKFLYNTYHNIPWSRNLSLFFNLNLFFSFYCFNKFYLNWGSSLACSLERLFFRWKVNWKLVTSRRSVWQRNSVITTTYPSSVLELFLFCFFWSCLPNKYLKIYSTHCSNILQKINAGKIPQNKNISVIYHKNFLPFWTNILSYSLCLVWTCEGPNSKYQLYLTLFLSFFILYTTDFIYLKSLLRHYFVQVLGKSHNDIFNLLIM